MRRETVDFGSPTLSAALLKLPASTIRAKRTRSFGSISILFHQLNNVIHSNAFWFEFGIATVRSSQILTTQKGTIE
jgi:hypothetical protein